MNPRRRLLTATDQAVDKTLQFGVKEQGKITPVVNNDMRLNRESHFEMLDVLFRRRAVNTIDMHAFRS